MKIRYNHNDKSYFNLRQIVNSVPKSWKKVLKESQSDSSNLVLLYHQIFNNNGNPSMDKMKSKEIYSIIITSKVNIAIFRIYFEEEFLSIIFNGKTSTHLRAKSL